MKLLAFIPARLESKRFPNKILKNIFNIPMIEHVRRRVLYSNIFHKVYVVTNSFKVKKIIQRYGGNVLLTKKKHFSGSSRVSEISKQIKYDFGFIIFADEPFINPNIFKKSLKILKNKNKVNVFNVITNLSETDLESQQVVKVLIDKQKFIIDYFRKNKKKSRLKKIFKSSGILIFKKKVFDNFKSLKIKSREKIYNIEQFRFLDNNLKVHSIFYKDIHPSINTLREFDTLVKNISNNEKELKLVNKLS